MEPSGQKHDDSTREEEKKVRWNKEDNVWKKVIVKEDKYERNVMKEEEACTEKESREREEREEETSTRQRRRQKTLENFKIVRTVVKKMEKPEKEEKEKRVKENIKMTIERKITLTTPKKAKISREARPYNPKILSPTPDSVTKKGGRGGLKLKENNSKKKFNLIKNYFEPSNSGGKIAAKNEFDQVARFQTKCENLPSTFTFKKQDQVVTSKLCQKAKYLLPKGPVTVHLFKDCILEAQNR